MSDLIDRQAAIDAMTEFYKDLLGDEEPKLDERTALYVDLKLLVERLPSAQPERKSGKWEMKWHRFFKREVPTCSVCKAGNFFKTKFCPNCGADMRGAK